MPKLSIFTVCDKAIVDEFGTPSLISLFTTVTGNIPPEAGDIPRNAVAPKEWVIFTAWDWEPGDAGKEYSQFVEILYPDGTVFLEKKEMRFVLQPNKRHQIRMNLQGFPIGQQGTFTVRMSLKHGDSLIFQAQPITLTVEWNRIAKPS